MTESEATEVTEAQKPTILYHASSDRDRTQFDPRAETVRDKDEGPLVFATPDKAYASCFIVPSDDSWVRISRWEEYDSPWCYIVKDRDRFNNSDHGGSIYRLPASTFNNDPAKNESEWTSHESVRPIDKEDFDSGLEAMLQNGVNVYFVDGDTFEQIQKAEDYGYSAISGLKPFKP